MPTSAAFGGPDGRSLYLSAWTRRLQAERMPSPGLAWAQAADAAGPLQRENTSCLPTALGTTRSSPNAFTSAVSARQPVQWEGTM